MVKSCCVLSCKNAFTKDSDLSFQRIPRDPEARRKWLSAIRRNNWNPGEDTWICGCHFVSGKRSYDPRHPDFVPSLFQYTTIAGRVQAVKNLKSYLQRKAVTKKNLLASTNREVAAMPDLSLQRVSASVIEAHNVQFQVIEIQTERAPADIAPLIERVESLNADVIKEEPHDGITSFHHQLQSLNTELTGEETHPDITSLHDQTEPLKGGIKTEEEHMDITSSHGHNPSLWAEVKPEDTSTELDSLHVQFESMQDEVKTENHVDVAPWCGQVEPLNAEVRTEETNGDVASLHERIRSLNAECQSLRDKVHRLENTESVQDVIMKAVPRLNERDYQDLITHLAGIGVKTECGIQLVTFKELKDIVPLLGGQRLVNVLGNRGSKNVTPGKLRNSKPGSSCSNISPIAPIQSNDWVSSYQVPWEKMSPHLRQCVAQGKRPRKQDHLAMVRIIVDSIRELCLNPSRGQCSQIAKGITDKYPQSFADLTREGEWIGCGYGSLLKKIKSRIENVNRDNRQVRVRRVKHRRIDDRKPVSSIKASASECSKTESYGCTLMAPNARQGTWSAGLLAGGSTGRSPASTTMWQLSSERSWTLSDGIPETHRQ
ncbi:peroxynitrite isomerase THAP4-like isoform X1 [Labrus mixtus]|uniref:peroxynitrite isomerase THAP4-like isoform X1 n=1 Tax=Labrus mixtus TaxID=508554 RepID=UPI0029BFD4A5|nr:peroxynitrite isomerase THAP4-like isoform X1 [Labrus mixtus]